MMIWLFGILSVLAVLWVLSVGGRVGHPTLKILRGKVFAHRGLHRKDRPENSLPAFAAAAQKRYGIELDLHLLQDGTLAVFHDNDLSRMTGRNGMIEALTGADLPAYTLDGTAETIPAFADVLALLDNSVPLIVELKSANGNARQLVDAAVAALADYTAPYVIESFDPRCLWHLRRRYPHIARGQLSQNFFDSDVSLSPLVKFLLTHLLTNLLTRPDFIAYRFDHRHTLSVWLARHFWHIQGATWTLTDKAQFDKAVDEGYLPIFEQFEP